MVRKAAAPARESEPAWSTMWEPAVLLHLLRVALHPELLPLVRATAASAYLVCAASLRLVNGLRSAPPILDNQLVFHGIAALSKGRRRSAMHPRPWSVPCASPDPRFSDADVATGLQEALNFLPPQSCSMFPKLINSSEKEVGVERASYALATDRANDAQLITSLTFIFTLPPLSLERAEARSIASKKHGPRHTLPEVGRVLGLPLDARNELGLWAGVSRGRSAMPNRYARDAERLLSRSLRSLVLCHIRTRMGDFQRRQLSHFIASLQEMQTAFAEAQAAMGMAGAERTYPSLAPTSPLGGHTACGSTCGANGDNQPARLGEPPAV